MKGGNGVREANGITLSPERRTFFVPHVHMGGAGSRQSLPINRYTALLEA